MRVELINLPFTDIFRRRLDPPLFLLQLAPKLEFQGFKIRVNDLNGIERDQWRFGHCVLYIMYVDSRSLGLAKKISKLCRQVNENSTIIVCGSGPSKDITPYINYPMFDVVIRGEAENAIQLFLHDAFQSRERNIQKVYKAEVRNLNALPLPSRHLIDVNGYHRKLKNEKALMVLGSRGSPYRQTWLCPGLKTFSVARIINEIVGVSKAYGIRSFFFGDDAFCFDKQRAISIADQLADNNFSFGFNDAITNIDFELLKKLSKLGCKEITINPFGSKSQEYTTSIKDKIEEDTGIRVILRHDGMYGAIGNGRGGKNVQRAP